MRGETGDLHPAKPCLLRDGSAEQGGVGVKEELEGGVVGREVTRTWFPARKRSQELQQFRLYFTGSSGILKKLYMFQGYQVKQANKLQQLVDVTGHWSAPNIHPAGCENGQNSTARVMQKNYLGPDLIVSIPHPESAAKVSNFPAFGSIAPGSQAAALLLGLGQA